VKVRARLIDPGRKSSDSSACVAPEAKENKIKKIPVIGIRPTLGPR
jgi:hypothetical protein